MTGVQSVERSFALLRAVATDPAGISELARRIDLPTSTVARLLATLEAIGAVARLDDGVTFRVGEQIAELAAAVDPDVDLATRVRPFLAELVARVGETAGISMIDGDSVLYVDQVAGSEEVRVRDWTGTRLPLHVVSSGLVLLAHQGSAVIDDYLRRDLERCTTRTVVEPSQVRSRLAEIRKQGFVWTAGEFDESITSVAAPIRDREGVAIAAIHVHGPSYRFPQSPESIVTALVEVCQKVSKRA